MKKLFTIAGLLLLTACSSGEDNPEETNTEETGESNAVEQSNSNEDSEATIGELVEADYPMTQSELEGTYEYNDKQKTTEVTFEEGGTLRVADGSGNLRYYVNEEYGRVVIDSVVHRVNKIQNGYVLISIDENGKRTSNDIEIINVD